MATISITESAALQINKLRAQEAEGVRLRILVKGGGCHGFQYSFNFDLEKNSDDLIFSNEGAEVIIDEVSLDVLDGSSLDYKQDLIGAAFVMTNPNATSSCGCGSSFSV